ncbi:Kinesin-like protein KIF21A [Lamellibrachia satsuma]|nr:Kinesin-like protein KIF21A [Lamellibrachia satsuma]
MPRFLQRLQAHPSLRGLAQRKQVSPTVENTWELALAWEEDRTVMIACVCPSDHEFMETLNLLKYANHAANIKNKVCINQDKMSRQMAAPRVEILDLQQELILYRVGNYMVDADGVQRLNNMFHENSMLHKENNKLLMRLKALQHTVNVITAMNIAFLVEHNTTVIASELLQLHLFVLHGISLQHEHLISFSNPVGANEVSGEGQ